MYTWGTRLLALAVAILIIGGSWLPSGQRTTEEWCDCKVSVVSVDIKQPDKRRHFAGFLAFGTIVTLALVGRNGTPFRYRVIGLVLLTGAGLGVATEVGQPIFERSCEVNDFIADMAGLIVGWGLAGGLWWLWAHSPWRTPHDGA